MDDEQEGGEEGEEFKSQVEEMVFGRRAENASLVIEGKEKLGQMSKDL